MFLSVCRSKVEVLVCSCLPHRCIRWLKSSLGNKEDECQHLRTMCETSQKNLEELAEKHQEHLQELANLHEKLQVFPIQYSMLFRAFSEISISHIIDCKDNAESYHLYLQIFGKRPFAK